MNKEEEFEEVILGNSIEFSPLIVGCMKLGEWGAKFDESSMHGFVEGCLELGFHTFDHADIYGGYTTEAQFGKVLKADPSLRENMQLISKCGIRLVSSNRPSHGIKSYDLSAEHIRESVEQSLQNLQTDYLDVLLLHRPDYLMNPYEVASVFEELQEEGKVLHFGVSNFKPSQVDLLLPFVDVVANQVQASVFHLDPFEDGTLDHCNLNGVQPMAWSPMAGGRYFDPQNEQARRVQKVVQQLCAKYDCTEDQLLLAWLLAHPSYIIPVLGTTKLERIESASGAFGLILEREDWYAVFQASTGQ
ncbi:aldo/keto reductase, partial [Chitinophagales bacterium]|nr:aldo/keto reductase [Chitinophagales bacterium]